MGPCQGLFCIPRAASMLEERRLDGRLAPEAPDARAAMRSFAAERFRGTRPIAWGDQLTELWLSAGMFRGTLAADDLPVLPAGADAQG
jgi:glycerol-3-phosphate dehydrogenase